MENLRDHIQSRWSFSFFFTVVFALTLSPLSEIMNHTITVTVFWTIPNLNLGKFNNLFREIPSNLFIFSNSSDPDQRAPPRSPLIRVWTVWKINDSLQRATGFKGLNGFNSEDNLALDYWTPIRTRNMRQYKLCMVFWMESFQNWDLSINEDNESTWFMGKQSKSDTCSSSVLPF